MPRHRAKGAGYPYDDEWRLRVDRELKDRGWTRAKLAEEAGIAPSVVTELLAVGAGKKTSRHLPRIHAAFGWPSPSMTGAKHVDPIRSEIESGLDRLDPDGLAVVLSVIKRMTPGKPED